MAGLASEDVMALIEGGNKLDERMFVQFHVRAIKNEVKSREEGRPIFDQVEYVKIATPGDVSNIVDKRATPELRARFPRQYAAFKGDLSQDTVNGTPLSAWPILSVAQVEELKHFRVHTVEQLAEIPDSALQNIGPILALRQQARDFISSAKGHAPLQKMRAELDERDRRIAALELNLGELGKKLEETMAAQRGAPPAPVPVPDGKRK